MSRSYNHPNWRLAHGLAASLDAAIEYEPPWPWARHWQDNVLRDAPKPVIVAELVRRGWRRKKAEHWLLGYSNWSHHDHKDDRMIYQRAYRHRTNRLVRMARFDDVLPFRRTHGWLSW